MLTGVKRSVFNGFQVLISYILIAGVITKASLINTLIDSDNFCAISVQIIPVSGDNLLIPVERVLALPAQITGTIVELIHID